MIIITIFTVTEWTNIFFFNGSLLPWQLQLFPLCKYLISSLKFLPHFKTVSNVVYIIFFSHSFLFLLFFSPQQEIQSTVFITVNIFPVEIPVTWKYSTSRVMTMFGKLCFQDLCSDLSHKSSIPTFTIKSVQSLVLTSKDNPLNSHMLKSATLLLSGVWGLIREINCPVCNA